MADVLSPVAIGLGVVVIIWLSGITYLVISLRKHYNFLVKDVSKKNLQSVLDTLIRTTEDHTKQLTTLTEILEQHSLLLKRTVRKVNLVRFNPFSNTGGEQSFTIALLDEQNSGIVITSLSGRNNTRWYAKQVKNGKGVEFPLSKEEEEAIAKAKPFV